MEDAICMQEKLLNEQSSSGLIGNSNILRQNEENAARTHEL